MIELKHKSRSITALELSILLLNIHRAANDPDIGFEHASQTLENFTARLNRRISVREVDLEAALWSANLLNEKERFWHPTKTFDEFVKALITKGQFNRTYNWIDEE